jgi:hypothetical protein
LWGHEGKDHGKGAVELAHNVERVRHAHGVEYGRLGRDQDEIGLARCLIGHVARDRRPVDHDKIGAGILAGFEHGGQAHRLNRRHGGRVELAHVFPERGRRLRVQVDDRSDLAGLLGRDRQTGGERRFPDAPFCERMARTFMLHSYTYSPILVYAVNREESPIVAEMTIGRR